ncbi:MAG: hypothetical protein NW226_06505 [Microscillaceae bacterium]|nr:hypothetical protein [Microscillaceae bacterium]
MFKLIKLTFGIVLLSLLFVSCNDDADDPVVITVDDAAEYVAASMAIATYGAVNNMNYVSEQIVELVECGGSQSDTRTETANNGDITVNFTINEEYSLACNEGSEVIDYEFTGNQTTDSERLDTDNEISADWTISGAESSSTALTYNGTYKREGDWTYDFEDNRTDNVISSFVYSDVKANKSDGIIFSGTSTFSLVGTSNVYEPFNYEGTITFQEDNTCIATFSTGEQYLIDLNTGDVTPIQ